ncbi:MAG: hypothetical protein DHS20C21_01950 [Gemmatimonadota bacterium]|nr:MAG: hypothetical protein DHS20C21_01950 [Gemmatimonadota bacterium]
MARSRFERTLFSCPEYVCTAYHFMGLSLSPFGGLALGAGSGLADRSAVDGADASTSTFVS